MRNSRFHPTPDGRTYHQENNQQQMLGGVGAFVGKKEPLFTSDGNVNYFSLHGNYCGESSTAQEFNYLMTQLLHPGTYPKDAILEQKHMVSMVFATLLTATRNSNHCERSSTDERIRKQCGTYAQKNAIQLSRKIKIWNLQVNEQN